MRSPADPKDDPRHNPIAKRLSGDFGSPLELMAARDLPARRKREILEVWLKDTDAQPDSAETRHLRASILEALASLEASSQ